MNLHDFREKFKKFIVKPSRKKSFMICNVRELIDGFLVAEI